MQSAWILEDRDLIYTQGNKQEIPLSTYADKGISFYLPVANTYFQILLPIFRRGLACPLLKNG